MIHIVCLQMVLCVCVCVCVCNILGSDAWFTALCLPEASAKTKEQF
jgi:hypothetical protein